MKTRHAAISLLLVLITGCASGIDMEKLRAFQQQKQSTLEGLGQFEYEKRFDMYETIDALSVRLLMIPRDVPLKTERTATFEGFPLLQLSDRDLDGTADQFAYMPEGGGNTQEFGLMFDLNRDGRVDYLVFNGGPLFNRDFTKRFWMNFHWIDSNHDGRTDIYVYNAIDLDGDEFLDEGLTAWLFDTDFNGTVDRAEYLGRDFQQDIEEAGGSFHIMRAHKMHKDFPATDPESFKGMDMTFADINAMLR